MWNKIAGVYHPEALEVFMPQKLLIIYLSPPLHTVPNNMFQTNITRIVINNFLKYTLSLPVDLKHR